MVSVTHGTQFKTTDVKKEPVNQDKRVTFQVWT